MIIFYSRCISLLDGQQLHLCALILCRTCTYVWHIHGIKNCSIINWMNHTRLIATASFQDNSVVICWWRNSCSIIQIIILFFMCTRFFVLQSLIIKCILGISYSNNWKCKKDDYFHLQKSLVLWKKQWPSFYFCVRKK